MELLSLNDISLDSKILLLKELGFDSDGIFVFNKEGEKIYDKYINEPIKIDNMVILPGSTVILDDNPLSIALYIEEYGNVF